MPDQQVRAGDLGVELPHRIGEPLEASRPYRIYSAAELDELPPPTWLIENSIPEFGLVAIIGGKGTYKTFITLDIACHIAAGLPWHARATRQMHVLYVYAEGPFGARSRVDAWCGLQPYTSGGTIRRNDLALSFLPSRVPVNNPRDVEALLTEIGRRPQPPRLVIIDTLNANLDGDEDGRGMSGFAKGCARIREAVGGTVIAVHHTPLGVDGRGRGHSSFDGEVDTRLIVSRDGERVTLKCTHQRNGPDGWSVAYNAVPVLGSLALQPSAPNRGELKGQRGQLLEILHQRGALSSSTWHKAAGVSKTGFHKTRRWLQERAYVRQEGRKYEVTDAGRLALGAQKFTTGAPSQGAPVALEGAPGESL